MTRELGTVNPRYSGLIEAEVIRITEAKDGPKRNKLRKQKNGKFNNIDWLRHYATSQKVAGSIPDEAIGFFSVYLVLTAALWPRGCQIGRAHV
jgi:hypothetical protein